MEYKEIRIKLPKPTREWFRYSTRTLLVLMLGVGIGAGISRLVHQPYAFIAQPAVWNTIGLNVQPIARKQLPASTSSRYRGGLRVVGVRAGSPASNQGLRKGDILVGVHVWETTNMKDLEYATRHIEQSNISAPQFFILRGKKTFSGQLDLK